MSTLITITENETKYDIHITHLKIILPITYIKVDEESYILFSGIESFFAIKNVSFQIYENNLYVTNNSYQHKKITIPEELLLYVNIRCSGSFYIEPNESKILGRINPVIELPIKLKRNLFTIIKNIKFDLKGSSIPDKDPLIIIPKFNNKYFDNTGYNIENIGIKIVDIKFIYVDNCNVQPTQDSMTVLQNSVYEMLPSPPKVLYNLIKYYTT